MLDESGLAGVSTRGLARRLGVEQPALYWHFPSKAALLDAMAEAAMRPHAERPLPRPADDWRPWFLANARSFRDTLLLHREGARLHAGSRPRGGEAWRVEHKIGFLIASGFTEEDGVMALLGASRFTLGCVLEEQADAENDGGGAQRDELEGTRRPVPDHAASFESGLEMLADGLARRQRSSGRS